VRISIHVPVLLVASGDHGTLAAVRYLGRRGGKVTVASHRFLEPAWSQHARRVRCREVGDAPAGIPAFVVRAWSKVLQWPRHLGIGIGFEDAPLDALPGYAAVSAHALTLLRHPRSVIPAALHGA
jgi:hypothetical protein